MYADVISMCREMFHACVIKCSMYVRPNFPIMSRKICSATLCRYSVYVWVNSTGMCMYIFHVSIGLYLSHVRVHVQYMYRQTFHRYGSHVPHMSGQSFFI